MQWSFAYGDRRLGNAWNGENVRRNGNMVIVCIRRRMCWFSNMASIGRNKYGEDVPSAWMLEQAHSLMCGLHRSSCGPPFDGKMGDSRNSAVIA